MSYNFVNYTPNKLKKIVSVLEQDVLKTLLCLSHRGIVRIK